MRYLPTTLLVLCGLCWPAIGAGDQPASKVLERTRAFNELTSPDCVRAKEELTLPPGDVVFSVVRGDEQCAYPLRVMGRHRIVNDSLGGPFLITWDADSSSARAFVPELNGTRLFFKFYGWYKGVMVMEDKETGSLWSHLTGEAIAGPSKGKKLAPLPVISSSWKAWKLAYPESWVLGFDYKATYDREFPKVTPELSAEARETAASSDGRLKPDARVVGINVDGVSKAIEIGTWHGDKVLAVGTTQILIYRGAGDEVTVFRLAAGQKLSPVVEAGVPQFVDEPMGTRYDLAGHALGAKSTSPPLVWMPAVETKWYAWAAFHPETTVEPLK